VQTPTFEGLTAPVLPGPAEPTIKLPRIKVTSLKVSNTANDALAEHDSREASPSLSSARSGSRREQHGQLLDISGRPRQQLPQVRAPPSQAVKHLVRPPDELLC
jgi:hypothetical protein